ncbi:MAG TPA: nucleotidyltransferase family protein [Burkholderiaceae bacterium]|nr:nucleotidyltransferase family protein [Burkholderiaceae bacterium]
MTAALSFADRSDLVSLALRQPMRLSSLRLSDWDLLVRQARRADLLGRIAAILDAQGSLDLVPPAPRAHLRAALALTEAQHAEVHRELDHIERAIAPTGVVPVLLKGAAYVAAGALPALGRSMSDIDILVPHERLAEVEAALMAAGWATTHHSAYDQRYYREWMHELPPMQHLRRQTVLDVHHAIVPLTARVKTSADALLAQATVLPARPCFAVLGPLDMVLHSMVHLFHNDDLSHALRDLSDLDLLLRQGGRDPAFWPALQARARELGLVRVLQYGLRYTASHLGTPVPPAALAVARQLGPAWPLRALADALWSRALRPQHTLSADAWSPLARGTLYLRAHWLRMPLPLLLRHIVVKALRLHESAGAARP